MEERRKQGLRYNCDEKWHTSHTCKGEILFLLEGFAFEVEHAQGLRLVELDDNGDVVIDLEEQDDKAEITLYALVGNPSPNTMRVKSKIKDQEVMSLLDSGSTHNFLDAAMAMKLKLQINTSKILEVKVANC